MTRLEKIDQRLAEIETLLRITVPEQIEAAKAKTEAETGIPRAQFGDHKIALHLMDDWERDKLAEERRQLLRERDRLPPHAKAGDERMH